MRCCHDNIRKRKRRWMGSASNQSSNMAHVNHRNCPNFLGDLMEFLEINGPWISCKTRNNHFWLFFNRKLPDDFIIEHFRYLVNFILDKLVYFSRKVNRMAMS